jgi:hypothetical protein
MRARTLAGIFLLTSSTLVFEINLASQFVISTGHHFASVVVSTALLGIGAAGVFVHVFPVFTGKLTPPSISFMLALAYPAVMAAAGQVAFDPVQLDWDVREIFHLFLYYPLFALPFFFSALVVTKVMREQFRHSGRIYFADMAGAAAGSLLFLLASRVAGLPIAVCIVFAGAAVFVFDGPPAVKWRGGMAALAAVTAVILYPRFELPLSPYKELSLFHNYPNTKVLASRRSPVGRLDIISSPYLRWAPGLNPAYTEPVPAANGIFLNGDLYTVLTPPSADYLLHLPASLPYRFARPGNVLIIGAGGDYEGRIARMLGSRRVTVVEEKKEIVKAIKKLYDPPYNLAAEPARSYLVSNKDAGGLDMISLALSTASRGLGSGVLSENYIYTSEFLSLCASRLAQGGILTATVKLLPPPRGETRLLRMMAELDPDGWENVAAFRSWGSFTAIYKKGGFSPEEIARLKRLADELSLDYVYYPGILSEETNRKNRMDQPVYYLTVIRIIFGQETLFNATPATDDSPFFGNYLRFSRLKETLKIMEGRWLPILTGGGMDVLVIAQAFCVSFALLLVPMIIKTGVKGEAVFSRLFYFFLLGAGYMLVELVFIQKGILALGNPVTAAAIVIPSFLGTSALGGAVSARFRFGFSPPAIVAALLLLSTLLLAGYLDPSAGYSGTVQYGLFFLTIFVTGFFMGMPYPLGLRNAGGAPGNMVAWGMAANGFASVIGAACAPFLALLFGFSRVLFLAAVLYLTAGFFASRLAGRADST